MSKNEELLQSALQELISELDAFFGPNDAHKPTDIRSAVKKARRALKNTER